MTSTEHLQIADLTPESLADLKRLAEAATPGPWKADDWYNDDSDNKTTIEAREPETVLPGQSKLWPDGMRVFRVAATDEGENPVTDAAFIAAANPQTVLALLARIEADAERIVTQVDCIVALNDEANKLRAQVAAQAGEVERVREALNEIASQPTLSELSERGEDCEGDFEGAYDMMIERARKAKTEPTP